MSHSIDELQRQAQQALEDARRLIRAEIAAYPTPISGCDAQFNHLLAERARVAAALEALRRDIFVPTPRSPMRRAGLESR